MPNPICSPLSDAGSLDADPFPAEWLALLRCPETGTSLTADRQALVTVDGRRHYRLRDGIPLFAEDFISSEGAIQRQHYDAIAAEYIANLELPHTQEYVGYLDAQLKSAIGSRPLGTMAELCCGRGEAIRLLAGSYERAVAVDVSSSMLSSVRGDFGTSVRLIQGDATLLPLADGAFDSVVLIGGIHHVNRRQELFAEALRILRPGGRIYFREPVDDFWLWRAIRKLIYRVSPLLDAETEHPVRWNDTVPLLEQLGFKVTQWRTFGFFGFCLFMNSDVLVFNRLFRFLPFIRSITRAAIATDHAITSSSLFRSRGLIVVGVAEKP